MMDSSSNDFCQSIIVAVEGKTFEANREALVESSAYFEAIFQPQHSGFLEKDSTTLSLKDVSYEIFEALLKHLPVKDEAAEQLASEMTPEMFHLCVRLMMKFDYESVAIEALDINNAVDYILAAEETASPRLLKAARSKICTNFLDFRRTLSFKELPKEDLVAYLSGHLQFSSEKQFLEAIYWWIRYDIKNRGSSYSDLIFLIDWSKFTKKQLKHMSNLKTTRCCPPAFSNILNEMILSKKNMPGSSECAQLADQLLKREFCRPHPLVLLVEAITFAKSCTKSSQSFAFYDLGNQSFLNYKVVVSDFPDGCAVSFYDGSLIIFGGIFGITTSRWNYEIKAYNIYTNRWRVIGRLTTPRRHFELVQNKDDFYLIGGTSKFRLPTLTMEKFNFKTGEVQRCADLVCKMHYPFACCWSGNLLCIFDGDNTNCPIYSYCPDVDNWVVHLPAVKVIHKKLCVALPCENYVYLTGYDFPILMKKCVQHLRLERMYIRKTWINDSELVSEGQKILSFFVHNRNIYSFFKFELSSVHVLGIFNIKTAAKSSTDLPGIAAALQKLIGAEYDCVDVNILKVKPVFGVF